MFLFWPITDDEDVEDKEEDWEFCCGAIHSWLGTLFFVIGDIVGLPFLLVIYCSALIYWDETLFANVHFALPILVLSVAVLTSPAGPIAVIRFYLCLQGAHCCSPTHNRLVVMALRVYLARMCLFAAFALFYASYVVWPLVGSGSSAVDICDWEHLWGFVHCIFVWTIRVLVSIGWALLAFQFSVGSCMCYSALGFARDRYRGYWDNAPRRQIGKKELTGVDGLIGADGVINERSLLLQQFSHSPNEN